MMLIVLSKNPIVSAELVPDKIKFKQLLELCQLICSAGLCNVYKPIKQGKKLQKWVKEHQGWVYNYGLHLYTWCRSHINMSDETIEKIMKILHSLDGWLFSCISIDTAIFRYSSGYESNIPTDTELSIDKCIQEYEKYVEWKGVKWRKN